MVLTLTSTPKRKFGDSKSEMVSTPFSSSKNAVKMVRVLKKELRNVGQFAEDEAQYGHTLAARIQRNGDVAVLRPKRTGQALLAQYGGALHSYMPRCTYTAVPGDFDASTANVHIDIFTEAMGRSTETVVCDQGGNMWIKVEEEDGYCSSFEYTITLCGNHAHQGDQENVGGKAEMVTCIEHSSSSTTFVGTSNMAVYCIMHAHGGRVMQCHRLQEKPKSMLGSILTKGTDLLVGKLFGTKTAAGNDVEIQEELPSSSPAKPGSPGGVSSSSCISRNGRRVITMYTKAKTTFGCIYILPLMSAGTRLLAVGSELQMWSGYDEPGKEHLEWNWDFFAQIFEAIEEGSGTDAIQVGLVQMELAPIQPGASAASLLVLALSSPPSPSASLASLWLLRVHIPLRSRAPPSVMVRQRVASSVDLEMALSTHTPAFHSFLEPSISELGIHSNVQGKEGDGEFDGDILVTWVQQPNNRAHTLFCGLVSASMLGGGGHIPENSHAAVAIVNCEVPASHLLSLSAVDSEEDLVALMTNGTLLRIMPRRSLRKGRGGGSGALLEGTPGKAILTASTDSGSKADVIRVMIARCRQMVSRCDATEGDPFSASFIRTKSTTASEETLAQLQHAFAAMSPEDIIDSITTTILQLINLDVLDADKIPVSASVEAFARVKVSMQRRVVAFYCLVRVLEEIGLLSLPESTTDPEAAMVIEGTIEAHSFAFPAVAISTIQLRVAEFEQSLLACTGLAISLHKQATFGLPDVDSYGESSETPLVLGHLGSSIFSTGESLQGMSARYGLRAISMGMTASDDERVGRGVTSASLSDHDVFPANRFFNEVNSLNTSFQRVVLQGLGHTTSLSGASAGLPSFAASMGVLRAILATFRGADAGSGSVSNTSAFICTEGARVCVTLVLDSLLSSVDSAALNEWGKERGESVLREEIKDFCRFAMESYALEAQCTFERNLTESHPAEENPRFGRYMSFEWKDAFRECQRRVSRLMLLLTTPKEAFALARTYLDCHGMRQSSEADLPELFPELLEACTEEGLSQGTEDQGLLYSILQSYESTDGKGLKPHRALYLFELGRTQPQIMDRFLSARPHLCWLHCLSPGPNKDLSGGAHNVHIQLRGDVPQKRKEDIVKDDIDNRLALASISKLSALASIATKDRQSTQDYSQDQRDENIYLSADREFCCASLQRLLGKLLGDRDLVVLTHEPSTVIKTALDQVTSLMSTKEGSGEEIIAKIYRILGLCLDLLRCSFQSDRTGAQSHAISTESWRQHVTDVWTCSLQCQTALWTNLGKEIAASTSAAKGAKSEPSADDILVIRGTVFHQLLAALRLPQEAHSQAPVMNQAVNISPDLPVILEAMGVKRDVSDAIEAALRI